MLVGFLERMPSKSAMFRVIAMVMDDDSVDGVDVGVEIFIS